MEVQLVRKEEQAAQVRILAWEFIDWIRDRYPDLLEEIEEYLTIQKFGQQLDGLLTYFNPPQGECLLATEDGSSLGIVMLKPYSEKVCEMNRMFVRAEARGKGVANALCERLISRAKDLGYEAMILSALDKHTEAIGLYKSVGFVMDERPADTPAGDAREVRMRMDFK